MTKTTELLKGAKKHEKRTSCRAVTWRCELKGRLEAMKEEVEFLNQVNLRYGACSDIVFKRINSLKEQIKQIEEKK